MSKKEKSLKDEFDELENFSVDVSLDPDNPTEWQREYLNSLDPYTKETNVIRPEAPGIPIIESNLPEVVVVGNREPKEQETPQIVLPINQVPRTSYVQRPPVLVNTTRLNQINRIQDAFERQALQQELEIERRNKLINMSLSRPKDFEEVLKNRNKEHKDSQFKLRGTDKHADGGYLGGIKKGLSSIEKQTIDKQKYLGNLPAVRYNDGGEVQKWGSLSISDKAPWIRHFVSKGITSSKGMEDAYNKYVDGGDKQVLNWPALQSVPHHVVANPDWNDAIETFAPNDLQRMWPGIDVTEGYYAKNPYPGENTIMYNPNDKTVDQNTIALDGLHFMRDNETYRSFYNDLLQEMPKDPQLLFESLNDQTWDEQLSRTLTSEILNKIQSNQELTPEEKEYFYPAVDGYLRRQFAPDYMISKTPGDHGYAPKYTGNQDILDKTNTIRELMESYILPEVTVTPDGLANKWYGPIVNYANDIMQGYHAEGGNLFDTGGSTTSGDDDIMQSYRDYTKSDLFKQRYNSQFQDTFERNWQADKMGEYMDNTKVISNDDIGDYVYIPQMSEYPVANYKPNVKRWEMDDSFPYTYRIAYVPEDHWDPFTTRRGTVAHEIAHDMYPVKSNDLQFTPEVESKFVKEVSDDTLKNIYGDYGEDADWSPVRLHDLDPKEQSGMIHEVRQELKDAGIHNFMKGDQLTRDQYDEFMEKHPNSRVGNLFKGKEDDAIWLINNLAYNDYDIGLENNMAAYGGRLFAGAGNLNKYQEGNEYNLSQNQIQDLLNQGYQIEYV